MSDQDSGVVRVPHSRVGEWFFSSVVHMEAEGTSHASTGKHGLAMLVTLCSSVSCPAALFPIEVWHLRLAGRRMTG